MALQAHEADLGAREHPRIRRAMRLMTRLAAFKPERCMFKRKWTALVAMAPKTSRLIRSEGFDHRGPDAAMRIVAVHTAHIAFGKLVVEGPLELGPDVQMTTSALRIDCFGLANHQGFRGMNFMAGGAGDLVLGVAALQPPHVRRLIQMTSETDLVGCRRGELARIADIVGRGSFGMGLPGTMASFAPAALPPSFRIGLHHLVRTLGESIIDILVADLTSIRSGKRWRLPAP